MARSRKPRAKSARPGVKADSRRPDTAASDFDAAGEEAIAALEQMLNSGEVTPDKVRAMLEQLAGAPLEGPSDDMDAEFQAQEVFFDAMIAHESGKLSKPKLAVRLKEVLKLDPGNSDAMVQLALIESKGAERIARIEAAVAAAEKRLGPRAMEEYAGGFWGFIETRPFMRALHDLAHAHANRKNFAKALKVALRMLDLNPGDNQGVRYEAAPWALAAGDNAAAGRILEAYPDDAFVGFNVCRAFHQFRKGNQKDAEKALSAAFRSNPSMAGLLVNPKAKPRWLPSSYALGSPEEAVIAAYQLAPALRTNAELANFASAVALAAAGRQPETSQISGKA